MKVLSAKKREINDYTERLIFELLIFDHRPMEIIHPWASYILVELSAKALEKKLKESKETEIIINDRRTYRSAREETAITIGIDKQIIPAKCPYNLVDIITKRNHAIFIFRDKNLNWRD